MSVLSSVDWEVRPRAIRRTPAGVIAYDLAPGLHGGAWAYVPAVPNQLITAEFYNATQQNIINNFIPQKMDDYSATIAEMGAETDPFPGGAPSQATTLAGELERIRYVLHKLNPAATAWYQVPSMGIAVPATGFEIPRNVPIWSRRTTNIQQNLIMLGNDDSVYVGQNLPADEVVYLGNAFRVSGGGDTYINGHILLSRSKWIFWDSIAGISVGMDNAVYLGNNASKIYLQKEASISGPLNVFGPTGVSGSLTVLGDIAATNNKIFCVNAVKAWARVQTNPLTYVQNGFSSIVSLGALSGVRFNLPSVPGLIPCPVATCEANSEAEAGRYCVTKSESSTQFVVTVRDNSQPLGRSEGVFNVIVL